MPQSMTGFANQTLTVGDWNLSIECKSVNSRFLDLTLKLPDVLKPSEPQFRKIVSDKIVRGKVELYFPPDNFIADDFSELRF